MLQMRALRDFFAILLFSKVVLLTPQPVDIIRLYEIVPAEPLEAITAGASIQIEVTTTIGRISDMSTAQRLAHDRFPVGSVQAELHRTDGAPVLLASEAGVIWSDDGRTWLNLSAQGGVPTDVSFTRVVITTLTKMTGVIVSWRNSSK